jgi:HD-GYP domain-containing protein (c-di-GMP phosphodiesterase class II)
VLSLAVDAMLLARSYKRGYPVETMLNEIQRCAGTQFDPDIAATTVAWCRSHPDDLVLRAGQIGAVRFSA